jgi:hypothetical protein
MLTNNSFVIVTPIYEDCDAAKQLFKEIKDEYIDSAYIVAVDDGSLKNPIDISNIKEQALDGVVIKLNRNVGHQRAIAIGLNYVAENINHLDSIVVMDSDGEDMPTSIRPLLSKLKKSTNIDLVVAQRKNRVETLRFKFFYIIYKWIFKLFTGRNIRFGNFMALRLNAVKRLVTMSELQVHLAGCVLASELRIDTCTLDRGFRYTGKSKMNFTGLTLHGFRGLMVFSESVLVRVGMACAVVAVLAIIGVIMAMGLKAFGYATPGWFSVALGILLLVFLQTGTLTLMTLMLTGIVKNSSITTVDYNKFVDTLFFTHTENPKNL